LKKNGDEWKMIQRRREEACEWQTTTDLGQSSREHEGTAKEE
jgi:hypothetical protein